MCLIKHEWKTDKTLVSMQLSALNTNMNKVDAVSNFTAEKATFVTLL